MHGTPPDGAATHPLTGVTAFTLRRRVSMREQYYEVRPIDAGGAEGDVVLHASQKQMTLPEEYRFSSDARHTRPCWTIRARTRMNLGDAVFEAFDERGSAIGWMQYRWLESEVLHTWRVVGPGLDVTGHQRSLVVGMARVLVSRLPFAGVIPVRHAFDVQFRDAADTLVLRVRRRPESRDRLTVTMPAGAIDARLAAGMALLLDWRGQA
ncbi:hypothetical protein GXB85_05525 [Cellulomonas sp. APG4]|uniref:hypothetical protein n=1 Tax=Cellulomonas sp. APG4 TaxID=1538656 RepID=UPI00137B19FE|nr:hypothetical protein [Cellulomonas sp. APG4]NCT90411.1 hypothetical protein [Cellulomonas sp. APG4]